MKIVRTLIYVTVILLVSCVSQEVESKDSSGSDVKNKATQELNFGKAGAVGRILTYDNEPFNAIGIRLAEIAWNADKSEGAFFLDLANSPGTFTLGNGYFYITNIKPGDYALIVGDVMDKHMVVKDDETGQVRSFTFFADQVVDIGDIKVEIP